MAYVICGIVFLIQDRGVREQCSDSGSSVWEYVLAATIFAIMRTNNNAETTNANNIIANIIGCACTFVVEGGITAWGFVEFCQNNCPPLKETSLWTFGQVTLALQVTIVLAYICIGVCVVVNQRKDRQQPLPAV